MKLAFTGQYQMNVRNILRRCGYGEQMTAKGVSYVSRLGPGQFPRFHAYVELTKDGFSVNVHLDQKAACYDAVSAHSGEYDGELVAKEGERITRWFVSLKLAPQKGG